MSGIYDVHSVTLNTHPGYDKYNKTNGTPTTSTLTGWLEIKNRLTLDKNGEQILSAANMLIDYNETITFEDTVTFKGRKWQIVSIQHDRDFTNSKTRIYLK